MAFSRTERAPASTVRRRSVPRCHAPALERLLSRLGDVAGGGLACGGLGVCWILRHVGRDRGRPDWGRLPSFDIASPPLEGCTCYLASADLHAGVQPPTFWWAVGPSLNGDSVPTMLPALSLEGFSSSANPGANLRSCAAWLCAMMLDACCAEQRMGGFWREFERLLLPARACTAGRSQSTARRKDDLISRDVRSLTELRHQSRTGSLGNGADGGVSCPSPARRNCARAWYKVLRSSEEIFLATDLQNMANHTPKAVSPIDLSRI